MKRQYTQSSSRGEAYPRGTRGIKSVHPDKDRSVAETSPAQRVHTLIFEVIPSRLFPSRPIHAQGTALHLLWALDHPRASPRRRAMHPALLAPAPLHWSCNHSTCTYAAALAPLHPTSEPLPPALDTRCSSSAARDLPVTCHTVLSTPNPRGCTPQIYQADKPPYCQEVRVETCTCACHMVFSRSSYYRTAHLFTVWWVRPKRHHRRARRQR